MNTLKSQSPVKVGTLIMKLLALLTMAAMAIGRSPPCEDYCRTMWFSSQLPPPWDPLCDCSNRLSATRDSKPVLTGTTIFNLHDTGVYFEPARLRHVDGKAYIDQPFYVVNHVTTSRRKQSKSAYNKATGNKSNEQKEKPIKIVKFKRKGGAVFDNSNSYAYFYKKSLVKAGSNANDHGSIEYFHKIEQNLSKCLDLYVLTVSRKYNNASELSKTWGSAKFHRFNKLSDDELKTSLQQECNEIEKFFKMNVEEIIEKLPKKQVGLINENLMQSKRSKPIFKPNYSNSYVRTRNANTNIKYVNYKNNAIPISPIVTTYATTLSPEPLVPVTGIQVHTPLKAEVTTQMVQSFNITPAKYMYESKTVQHKSDEVMKMVKPNDNVRKSPSTSSNKRWAEENMQVPNNNNSLTLYNKMQETNKAESIAIYEAKALTDDDNIDRKFAYVDDKYLKSTLASVKNNPETVTIIYPKRRPKHDENKVPPQRLITKEFANDTAVSLINGTEDLQRDDSLNVSNETEFVITNHVNASGNLIETTVTELLGTIGTGMDGQLLSLLMGNLYFLFGEDYIPAKFVQKSDGKLLVALDSAMICTKLNEEHQNKSLILAGLCDCVKFNNCSKLFANNPNN